MERCPSLTLLVSLMSLLLSMQRYEQKGEEEVASEWCSL
jgi:hypothetical protein